MDSTTLPASPTGVAPAPSAPPAPTASTGSNTPIRRLALAAVGLLLMSAGSIVAQATEDATIRGTVRAQGAGPLDGVTVTFVTADGSDSVRTATGADGRFTLSVSAGPRGDLVFRHPDHLEARQRVEERGLAHR